MWKLVSILNKLAVWPAETGVTEIGYVTSLVIKVTGWITEGRMSYRTP